MDRYPGEPVIWPLIRGGDIVRVVLATLGLMIGLAVVAAVGYAVLVMLGFDGPTALTAPVAFFAEGLAILGGIYTVMVRGRGLNWRDLGWNPVSWSWALLAVAACVGVYAAFITVQLVMGQIRVDATVQVLPTLLPAFPVSPLSFVFSLLGGAVLVPIAEEFLFRGILYRWLRDRWGVWLGTVVSAAVFTAMHPPGAGSPVQIFVMALALAVFYERSRSAIPSMVLHATNNAIGIALIYATIWFGGP